MELALEAVKSTNLVYYDKYQYEEVTVEGCTIQDLPLVPANRTKKSYKEFFQHVPNVSEQELQSIQAAFVDGTLNLPGLPDCVRPRDYTSGCRLCASSSAFSQPVFCQHDVLHYPIVDAGSARLLARSDSQCFANTVFCTILVDAGSARVLALSQGHGFVNMVCYYFITVGNEPGARRNIAVSSFQV